MFNLQKEKQLATFIKEQQDTIDQMINAGLDQGDWEEVFAITFIHNLCPDYADNIRKAENEGKINTKLTWAGSQTLAREWLSHRVSLDAALLNNGQPTSSTGIHINSTTTNKPKYSKAEKKAFNENKKLNKAASISVAAAASNKSPASSNTSCVVCGFNPGHNTADCPLLKNNQQLRAKILNSAEAKKEYFKSKRSGKEENNKA